MKQNIFKIDGFIYVTSDEDIKSKNWILNMASPTIYKAFSGDSFKKDTNTEKWRKIILTTDKILIKDGVQQLTEEEVAYCEVNDYAEIKVVFEQTPDNLRDGFYYKPLITKEQTDHKGQPLTYWGGKEKETIEQKKIKKDSLNYRLSTPNKMYIEQIAFEAGANSQQPIIDQLKREKEEIIDTLGLSIQIIEKLIYSKKVVNLDEFLAYFKQLIQKYNG